MKAQPSWQILECCLKKMMLIITASTSPVFWCSAPPADLGVSWLLLAPSHPFAVLCSDLVREIAAYSPSLPPLPAPHMSFKFYYCNKSALCWLFSKKKKAVLLDDGGITCIKNSLFLKIYLFGCARSWEKAMTTHSSSLARRIPWMEEPGRLRSMGLLRVGRDWASSLSLFTFMHWRRKWQPTPVFLPGESQGRGSLVGCRLWGRTESDTTEVT